MRMKLFVADGAIFPHRATDGFLARFSTNEQHVESMQDEGDENQVKSRLRRGVAALSAVSVREAEEFLHGWPLEPSFVRFVEFCREYGLTVNVVSDGLDYCLETIFALKGIRNVRTYANHAEIEVAGEAARFQVSFPYDDAECTRCACCARNIMLTTCADDERIVFVGTDDADVCPAEYADVVFAKGALQSACQERNISYVLYSSFDDVAERLAKLGTKRNLRPRREAAMRRRNAFIAEW